MESNIKIETIGIIEKKETLSTVGYNELVLESAHPFPGYHGTTVPDQDNPKSIFFITKSGYPAEDIVRATQSIKKKSKIAFDGTPAHVSLPSEKLLPAIRIKDLEDYQLIPELLKLYKEAGIQFASHRKIESFDGTIRVRRMILLEGASDCTLQDSEVSEMMYFQLPRKISWEDFEKITIHIKRNMEDPNFDAALATIFRKNGLIDYIRIYDVNCTKDKLNLIRNKYLQEMKRIGI